MGNFLFICFIIAPWWVIQNNLGMVNRVFYPDLNWFCRFSLFETLELKEKQVYWAKAIKFLRSSCHTWLEWFDLIVFYFVVWIWFLRNVGGNLELSGIFIATQNILKSIFYFVLENAGATKTATFKLKHVFEFRV